MTHYWYFETIFMSGIYKYPNWLKTYTSNLHFIFTLNFERRSHLKSNGMKLLYTNTLHVNIYPLRKYNKNEHEINLKAFFVNEFTLGLRNHVPTYYLQLFQI